MPLTHCASLSPEANAKLAALTESGQVDYLYATNPTDWHGRGSVRHVLLVRDEHGDMAEHKIGTAAFSEMMLSMQVRSREAEAPPA